MNLLHRETSPYLLQHANNPVHWRAWNNEALAEARNNNRLMIVSSGYSACHWCHVMEHECFEDNEVAEVMNRHYVSIKVDREERPDVDAVYMKAVQLMTRQGGWPMNVICLPDGRPVWGGTYFPKPDWIAALEQLAEMYQSEPEKMIEYAEKLHQGIEAISLVESPSDTKMPSQEILKPLIEKWRQSFDPNYGGYARAPKFMLPNNWRFLLRYAYQTNDSQILDQVKVTLSRVAWGGLFDTVGGGFSRYSVDTRWHVPHFEKMLYDNGQLVSLYADAHKLTKDPFYLTVIRKTLDFIARELTDPDGAFYSALDADSIDKNGNLTEGAFYVWTEDELQKLLGVDYDFFSRIFNVDDFGHWEHGNYVLIQNRSDEEIANELGISTEKLAAIKERCEKILLNAREKRIRPRRDEKRLTAWNAMMLNGYVDAYKATGEKSYLDIALRNASFIINQMWSAEGHLFRNFKDGKTTITGFLDDYAFTIEAFINLYTASADEKWLMSAKQLTDYCLDHFYQEQGGFFSYSADTSELIAAHFEIEDNVIPASNSVMAKNLMKLSVYFGNTAYENVAKRMVSHIIPHVDYPSAFSNWLDVFLDFNGQNRELAICGSGAHSELTKVNGSYLPNVVIAATEVPSSLPFLENRFVENKLLFYVCRDRACGMPEDTLESALSQIKS